MVAWWPLEPQWFSWLLMCDQVYTAVKCDGIAWCAMWMLTNRSEVRQQLSVLCTALWSPGSSAVVEVHPPAASLLCTVAVAIEVWRGLARESSWKKSCETTVGRDFEPATTSVLKQRSTAAISQAISYRLKPIYQLTSCGGLTSYNHTRYCIYTVPPWLFCVLDN